jgi:hypothetical protein
VTRSNRIGNRIIIALLGLVLLAAAAWVGNRAMPVIDLPAIPAPTTNALWITAAIALVVVVLSLLWIFTRGRGHTRTVVTVSDDSGTASVDARVAADFITEDVSRIVDVVSVASRAYRTDKKTVALELRVTTRRSADVRLVVDAVKRAVIELDDVLETRIPVLLHVATGVRASFAREQRVH